LLAESLFYGETDRLSRRAIYSALKGDAVALRLCLERILPPVRSRPISFKLPELRTASDAMVALTTIIEGVTSGRLLPEEAESLTATISTFIKAHEICTFEERLVALESRDQGGASRFRARAKHVPRGAYAQVAHT
jgi:hypothetical protein